MKSLFCMSLIFVSWSAAAELTIFDVRKNLAMSDDDKVYRDFYINGGTEAGLANGMVIIVERRMPLYDSYQNRSAGDLDLKVARIKIIHAQKGLAVARLHSEFTRDNAPLLEDNFIMVGDRLNLASATSDKKAELEQPQHETVASVQKAEPRILVNAVEIPVTPEAGPKPASDDAPVLQ